MGPRTAKAYQLPTLTKAHTQEIFELPKSTESGAAGTTEGHRRPPLPLGATPNAPISLGMVGMS